MPERIKSEGKQVFLKPIIGHPAYGAGSNGYVYSFCIPGGGFSYLNMPYKLSRYTIANQGGLRPQYSLESPDGHYDAATLIANAWVVGGVGNIVGMKNGNIEDLRPNNLQWMSKQEYFLLRGYNVSRMGDNNGRHKLTKKHVGQIIELRGHVLIKDIAGMFNVDRSTISAIYNRTLWKHLPPLPKARPVICKMCGKTVSVPYGLYQWKFCSRKCKNKWSDRPRYKMACCVCGKTFFGSIQLYRRLKKNKDYEVSCSVSCRTRRINLIRWNKWA